MTWIEITERKPITPGKFIIRTITKMGTINRFEARFDGHSFDVNNQRITHWLEE